jgi:hypothetical protein
LVNPVISKKASEGLTEKNFKAVGACFEELLIADVNNIEHVAGGGIRCMIAGVHLMKN